LILFDAVMPEVNARQDKFAVAIGVQTGDFVENILRRAAADIGANRRNDAEAAIQQAPVLNLDISSLMIGKSAQARRRFDHAPAAEQVRQLAFVGDDLDDVWQGANFVRRARRIATHHNNASVRIPFGELANRLAALGVAFVGDGARVDDADLRRFIVERITITGRD
jgi:hypothetical protein